MNIEVINIYSDTALSKLNIHCNEVFKDQSIARSQRPPKEIRRRLSLALARSFLKNEPSVEIMHEPSGRPFLKSPQTEDPLPYISISHSGQWLGCVLSDPLTPICIDIEDMEIHRSYNKIAEYAFSESENQYIALEGKIGFYKLWTAKEAIAKCQGKGLNTVMKIDLGSQLVGSSFDLPVRINVHEKTYEIKFTLADESVICTFAQEIKSL